MIGLHLLARRFDRSFSTLAKTAFGACLPALAAIGLASAALAEQRLTVVADEWPPFSGMKAPERGISIDVITTVFTRAGYNVTSDILPWPRIMFGAKEGEFDVIGSLYYDTEMLKYLTFSDPFFGTDVKFVQPAGSDHSVDNLDALRGYSIAVGDGFLYEEAFDRADYLDKRPVGTTDQALHMVAFGRADLTLDSEDVIKYALHVAGSDIAEKVEILPHVLARRELRMAVRNDLPNKERVIADFNKMLGHMQEDGSLERLLEKHVDY